MTYFAMAHMAFKAKTLEGGVENLCSIIRGVLPSASPTTTDFT